MKNNFESGLDYKSKEKIKRLILDCLEDAIALRNGKALVVDPVRDEIQQEKLDEIIKSLREILTLE